MFLSHDGTGCPPEETECLIRYLDARDEWLSTTTTRQRSQYQKLEQSRESKAVALTKLSMDYRAAMCECLLQLQNKNSAVNIDNGVHEGADVEENDKKELLSLTYAISHLAEIFLLPSLSSCASPYPSNVNQGWNEPNEFPSRLDGPSGSLTADTVRYLRLHHAKAYSLMYLQEVQEMLESDQPEYYQFPASTTSPDNLVPGPFDYPYWNLLLQLVRQGELEKAWAILSRHSACRHAEEEVTAQEFEMRGDQPMELSPETQGFAALRGLLLSAPIPGGRGDR